jgi:hypothetical protein
MEIIAAISIISFACSIVALWLIPELSKDIVIKSQNRIDDEIGLLFAWQHELENHLQEIMMGQDQLEHEIGQLRYEVKNFSAGDENSLKKIAEMYKFLSAKDDPGYR